MKKKYRIIINLLLLLLIITSGTGRFSINAGDAPRPEVRAFWVDAFHDGIKTPDQIDKLIQDSVTANINTLIVQVRRRGDAYYNKIIEPRTEDPDLQPEFDALQYLIEKAHAEKIEVHAWLNTLVAWNSSQPPADPRHVWNLHGPDAVGSANWISYYRTYNPKKKQWSKKLQSSFYLDPGHPNVLDYTASVYLNLVKNYDVEGIHLDYSRYAGLGWGYNPTSVARYNAQYGTSGLPEPDDPRWKQWQREQTAGLVRKIYLEAIAIKPNLKVSSAVITWGEGPVAEGDWEKSRAYSELAQDWRGWLMEGIIDMVMPMNYFCEWKTEQQLHFNQWIEWEKDHQYGRQIVIGPGIFAQYFEQSLDQIRRSQMPSTSGNYAAGVSLYAYGENNLYNRDDFKTTALAKILPRQPHVYMPDTNNWLFSLLSREGGYLDPVLHTYITTHPVFPAPAVIPDMPWKSSPANGYLMGTVTDSAGKSCDHLKVRVDGIINPGSDNITPDNTRIQRTVYTDGNGWFGLAELPPGDYHVWIDQKDFPEQEELNIRIKPGLVSKVDLGQPTQNG